MTLPIARELARYGIRVMTIAPRYFETPMLAGLFGTGPPRSASASSSPGRPDEYAALAKHIIGEPDAQRRSNSPDGAIRMQPR